MQFSALAQDNRIAPATSNSVAPVESASKAKDDSKVLKITPGDLLDVSVFGLPELGRVIRVNSVGEVSLPLIGALQVANLTTEQAQNKIAKEFQDQNFLQGP